MERNIWEEFDEKIDVEGLKKDVAEAAENSGDFKKYRMVNMKLKLLRWNLKNLKKEIQC